jgi:hypothetical protein
MNELKKLALECNERFPELEDHWATVCTPSVVLSFVEEFEELKTENAGLRTGYEAFERANAELRGENRAMLDWVARGIYEQWSAAPGYVPWVARGNSTKQDEARSLARAAMGKGEPS